MLTAVIALSSTTFVSNAMAGLMLRAWCPSDTLARRIGRYTSGSARLMQPESLLLSNEVRKLAKQVETRLQFRRFVSGNGASVCRRWWDGRT